MGTAGQSITLANSIIGVGILAMPFCFQQCGVVLATLILLFMGMISRLCCYFLLKAALMARRRNFEFLAFHIFGPAGKLAVEVGIIGFLMGTCIAYFVVVGDLGPQIIAKLLNINQSDILRTSIMVVVSLVCVLPLGLLRNVDSLSNVSAATIGFYFCLVIKVISEAGTQMFSRDWHLKVEMWKPSGLLQCVPIFSMALFCQTQLFEIFEPLPTLSLEKMNVVTKNALNICTAVYFTLGLFGYIAFGSHTISGNVLMSLSPTMASDVIKLGFVMSVAFSFPLIIFPCRASIYSFLYGKVHPPHHDHIINHSIPETTFRCITVGVIVVALFVSLLIPNIELVLGLVGATIGVLVCVVFPAAAFLRLKNKSQSDEAKAKSVLILGLVILVLGTYANLQAAESQPDKYDFTPERIEKIVEDFFEEMEKKDHKVNDIQVKPHESIKHEEKKDSVIQPPNPVPPAIDEKQQAEKILESGENKLKPAQNPVLADKSNNDRASLTHPKDLQTKLDEFKSNGADKDTVLIQLKDESKPQSTQEKIQEKMDTIKKQNLIETIKQHREEQKELIEEQKEILDEIKKTKNELHQQKQDNDNADANKIAVESIQKIADIAIKKLSGVSEKPENTMSEVKNEPLETLAHEVVQEIAKKAQKAIEEIAEQKPAKQERIPAGEVLNVPNNNLNSVADPNNGQASKLQPNAPNKGILPSVSNFAPINPPVASKKITNVPVAQMPQAESVVQSQNVPPVPETNNIPVISKNVPLVNPQPIINKIVNNAQAVENIPIPSNQGHQQQSQSNVLQNQNREQLSDIVQQLNQPEQKKRSVDVQTVQKNVIDDQGTQKFENNVIQQKPHSHSLDEPQSYKQGEDLQQHRQVDNNVAQNVPIPIAMNGNAQASQEQTVNKNKETIAQSISDGKAQPVFNVANNANEAPRHKREIVVETVKSLGQEKEENCNIKENKIRLNNKVDTSEEILPSSVNLAEVGLKKLPAIQVGRSLKSIENVEKKR